MHVPGLPQTMVTDGTEEGEGEREREKERQRERQRETDRERQREREKERDREAERGRPVLSKSLPLLDCILDTVPPHPPHCLGHRLQGLPAMV